MSRLSAGARQLKKLVAPQRKMSQRQLALKMGLSSQAITAWVKGISKPDAAHQKMLHELLGIDPSEWVTAPADPIPEPRSA